MARPYVMRLPNTQVSPFMQYHKPILVVCSLLRVRTRPRILDHAACLRLHHIWVMATKLGPMLASKAPRKKRTAMS